MNRYVLSILALCMGATANLQAQMDHVMTAPFPMQGPGVVGFHTEWGEEDKVVKGQPFSADITTTHVQTLADGNRITNTTTSHMYRDSEGRTRRENTLMLRGMDDQVPKIITINDPVAGTRFFMNDMGHTAQKIRTNMGPMDFKHVGDVPDLPPMAMGTFFAGPTRDGTEDQKSEDLGEKSIEGVMSHGTRLTSTIPAGKIGNERPITVTTELWHSVELGIDMLKIHNDPWSGETTTKVTNISRTEPDKALFAPPGNYKVMEPGKNFEYRYFKKKMPPPPDAPEPPEPLE